MAPLASPEATCWTSCSIRLLALVAEIGFADRLVVLHVRGFSRHHHASSLQHVSVIGELKRQRRILLYQQHADFGFAVDAAHDTKDFLHDEWGQPEGGLVEQHQAWA